MSIFLGKNEIGEYHFHPINKTVIYGSRGECRFLEYLDENDAIQEIKTQSLVID